jgi:hypothetical protein
MQQLWCRGRIKIGEEAISQNTTNNLKRIITHHVQQHFGTFFFHQIKQSKENKRNT